MGENISKMKTYVFVSIISLLINIGAICVGFAYTSETINESDMPRWDPEYEYNETEQNVNFSLAAAGLSAGGAFLPFVSIIGLAFMGLPAEFMLFVTLVIVLLGAIQAFIILIVATDFIPFVDT